MPGRHAAAAQGVPVRDGRASVTEHEYKTLGDDLVPALDICLLDLDGVEQPPTPAIIDSGADISTFPGEWAEILKIKLDLTCCEEKKARTAGGPAQIWHYSQGLHVVIEGERHHLKANFCETLEVPLLGRRDFFLKYRIAFDERAKSFTLDPYRSPAN